MGRVKEEQGIGASDAMIAGDGKNAATSVVF